MLVYGDHRERAEPDGLVRDINRELQSIVGMPSGLQRHSRLVGALITAGELLQGIEDDAFSKTECDGRDTSTDALRNSLVSLGRAVCRSWDTGFQQLEAVSPFEAARGWPAQIDVRIPEGYAFYALYPEAYVEAARRVKLTGPPRVIGIRSIGTSLAAVVAAALGAPFATVRPFGDPFDRKIALDAQLEREVLADDAHYIIVDEGPGQSGSSFAAVVDWLRERGVPLDRIALLPSHDGPPAPAATQARLHLWREVQRQVGDFGDRWIELIARWCGSTIGDLDEAPKDISGGAWRRLVSPRADEWPAVVPAWERRKFLLRSSGDTFVAKFAGLGRIGEEKLAIAGTLRCEGLVPEPIALAHGFLIQRWYEDAAPVVDGEQPLGEVGRYIGTRARLLPAASGSGATIGELLRMVRRNICLEFGEEAALLVDRWESRAADLERRVVRVRTDNKLDRHEWLRTGSGALIKADALDHCQAHDLIGCQDVAWDAVGALIEFDVPQRRSGELIEAIKHWSGSGVDTELLAFYRLAYLAFHLGQARLGASVTTDRSERVRIQRRGDHYASELQDLLEGSGAATRPETLVC
jgi:hypothetical protein